MTSALAAYFERYGFSAPAIAEPPAPGLGLIVVIPCNDEPRLVETLESLRACRLPGCGVEVIVVVNAAEDAAPEVHARNGETALQAREWAARNGQPEFRIHILSFPALPARQAGVGLARKIGMDEALARLDTARLESDHPEGPRGGSAIIANLDADCRCAPNYLVELERHFRGHPASDACSIYFEHPLDEADDAELREGILLYELKLRGFTLGLKGCGYPFAHHTLGSCFAVRAQAYRRQGGMNRRQAGEDFYFLNKFMILGTFSELRATTVFPSSRASHRVPFGTGRAMRGWLQEGAAAMETYDPRVFEDLREMLERVPQLYRLSAREAAGWVGSLPAGVAGFLEVSGFAGRLLEMQQNSASEGTFTKRFFHWFDRFRVLKYVHFASKHHYPRIGPVQAAARLLAVRGLCRMEQAMAAEPRALLDHLRRMEREEAWLPFETAGG